MYVCVCKAVTDRQIRKAVSEGASSLRDLRRHLGVCSGCGKCGECAREVLDQCLSEIRALSPAPTIVAAAC